MPIARVDPKDMLKKIEKRIRNLNPPNNKLHRIVIFSNKGNYNF
jgi:hypothetical protein